MSAEASLYIPKEEIKLNELNSQDFARTKDGLCDALKNYKDNLNLDLFKMSENLTLQGKTELVQRYAVGAISKIVNDEPITNEAMLDALFNTYAPAFNATLEKSGYNSLIGMKNAALEGTINPASFLSAFNSGLIAMQDEINLNTRFDKYGDEIPFDVVEEFKYTYFTLTAEKKTVQFVDTDYVDSLAPINLTLTVHIKNENAKNWKINDYSDKLAEVMAAKKYIVLRLGHNIYEDVLLKSYNPVISNAYEIKSNINLTYLYQPASKNTSTNQSDNSVSRCVNKQVGNWQAKNVYCGSYFVEYVNPQSTVLTNSALNLLLANSDVQDEL